MRFAAFAAAAPFSLSLPANTADTPHVAGCSFFMVNPEDLRRLEAAERNAASHGAPSVHNRSSSRRRGADINLPDDDMLTGEDGVSGCATAALRCFV